MVPYFQHIFRKSFERRMWNYAFTASNSSSVTIVCFVSFSSSSFLLNRVHLLINDLTACRCSPWAGQFWEGFSLSLT
uniref:Uncharacterized protein n=1 Tax=Anguilla anguilla TaxID=7936 RepID=A0A0E9WCQ7_ANGAN